MVSDKNLPSMEKFGANLRSLTFVLVFGVLAMTPFYIWGFPKGADFDNHFRFALPLYDEIMQGNFFPGWLAESNDGYGDPRFSFYPPFLYYLLCLFRYVAGNWYAAGICVFTLFSLLGTLGVYLWTRQSFSDNTAIIAAFIFSVMPYHLTQFYQASLIAEFAATSLLPFAFLAVDKLTSEKSGSFSKVALGIGGLAAAYSLIITTHLPTTVILSLSLGLFALLSTNWTQNKKGLIYCATGIFLGLLSSSWFWVKMVSELSYIQAGSGPVSSYYDYRNNFVFSPFSSTNLNMFFGSTVAALTIAIFLPTVIIGGIMRKKKNDLSSFSRYFSAPEGTIRRRLIVLLIVAFFALFMTTDLSRPIWAIVPKLKDVQFPYRWLSIASVVICPVVAFALQVWRERWRNKSLRAFHLPFVFAFFIAIPITIQLLVLDSDFLPREGFAGHIEAIRGARSFKDWLPVGAKELKDLPPLNGLAEAGERHITINEWHSHHRTISIGSGPETTLKIRTYIYPNWKVSIDGHTHQEAIKENENGIMAIEIPNEKTTVKFDFIESERTKKSRFLGVFGWLVILVSLSLGFFKIRK